MFGTLGAVAQFINGAAFKPEDWGDEGIPIIRIQNLTDTDKPFNRTKRVVADKLYVQPGDLLVSWSATLGVYTWSRSEVGVLNQHIFRVVPDEKKVDGRYLRHALSGALQLMGKHLHGATMQHVNRGEFLAIAVYLPALSEQRRIAAILDQAETLRAQRRAAIAQFDSLGQAVFLEMFGDPVARGGATVAEFVKGFESGKSLAADDEDDTSSRYRVLKVSAVTSLTYRLSESKALPPNYVPPRSHFVRAGDLLFSRANTSDLIGATAFVDSTPPDLLLPDKLWRFVWHDEPRALPHYVAYLFRQPKFRAEIARRASGTSGSMKNISQEKVLSIKVSLPGLALQEVFARRIQSIEALKSAHRAALTHLDELFASLQHRAFRGELTASEIAPRKAVATRAVDLEGLRKLEGDVGLEALIFVINRRPDRDLYASLKTLYVADKMHLEKQGKLIYGETYNALPMGPVPEAAYLVVKVLRNEQMFGLFDEAATRAALRVQGKQLIPLRAADLSKLDSAAIQSLEAAIRYFAGANFGEVKAATHDTAYHRTQPNAPIPMEYLIDMLPAEVRQRHWGDEASGSFLKR